MKNTTPSVSNVNPFPFFVPRVRAFVFFLYLHKTHPSGSPTKKDAENDPLRTRTQATHKTARGQMPVPSPVSSPSNPRDRTKKMLTPANLNPMPPPETFVYRQTHHSTIPIYVCVDQIIATVLHVRIIIKSVENVGVMDE